MAHSAIQIIRAEMNKEESQAMMEVWPDFVRDVMEANNLNIPELAKWMEKLLEYNIPVGKKFRGMTLIHSYKMLMPNERIREENMRIARILAWCVELLNVSLLVVDDVMDSALLRRGNPSWYRCHNIGDAAINDGILLENAPFYIIRKYLKGKDCYVNILEIFHEAMFTSLIGQCLDMFSSNFEKRPNLDMFTMNCYKYIAKLKTAYYTFYLPVAAAMHLAGIKDPEMFKQAKLLLLEMGYLYQIQDDGVHFFKNPECLGKSNTDIEEGKCTWLSVVALQRATPEQRKILKECYGYSDPEKVKCVRQLFADLDLENIYSTYEKEKSNLLNAHVQQISWFPHNLFLYLLSELHYRFPHQQTV